ncbi:MAG TPA: IPExxxVDY family protein [Bacteroidia bacterium]|jgi:hypothetical protein|nr:IPExxxVDY family protein [Bacteroidia bacterium]
MSKTRLIVEYDYDFCLIGIACHEKDYRLCWTLNTLLQINLSKKDDHLSANSSHSLFHYNQEQLFREYYLVSNRGTSGMLVEEHRQVDYFFIARGDIGTEEQKHFLDQFKSIEMVSAAYPMDANLLKSKHNLIFE